MLGYDFIPDAQRIIVKRPHRRDDVAGWIFETPKPSLAVSHPWTSQIASTGRRGLHKSQHEAEAYVRDLYERSFR